jgi:hypothetical protein
MLEIKDLHSKAMKFHGNLYNSKCTITYTINSIIKAYDIKCTVASLSDEEKATGKYSLSTLYFTLYYDNIKISTEKKTKTTDCITSGFQGKSITYNGVKYAIDAENPNGSTRDCVVLRGVISG